MSQVSSRGFTRYGLLMTLQLQSYLQYYLCLHCGALPRQGVRVALDCNQQVVEPGGTCLEDSPGLCSCSLIFP